MKMGATENMGFQRYRNRLRLKVNEKDKRQRQLEKAKILAFNPVASYENNQTRLRVLSLPSRQTPTSRPTVPRLYAATRNSPSEPSNEHQLLPPTMRLRRSVSQHMYVVHTKQKMHITQELKQRQTKIIEQLKIGLQRKLSKKSRISIQSHNRSDPAKRQRSRSKLILVQTQPRMFSSIVIQQNTEKQPRTSQNQVQRKRTSILDGQIDFVLAIQIIEKYLTSALNEVRAFKKKLREFERRVGERNMGKKGKEMIIGGEGWVVAGLEIRLAEGSTLLEFGVMMRKGSRWSRLKGLVEMWEGMDWHATGEQTMGLERVILHHIKDSIYTQENIYINLFKISSQQFYAAISSHTSTCKIISIDNNHAHKQINLKYSPHSGKQALPLLIKYSDYFRKAIETTQQNNERQHKIEFQLLKQQAQNQIFYTSKRILKYSTLKRMFDTNYLVTMRLLSNYIVRIEFQKERQNGNYQYIQTAQSPQQYFNILKAIYFRTNYDINSLFLRLKLYKDQRLYHRIQINKKLSSKKLEILNTLPQGVQFIGSFVKKVRGEYHILQSFVNTRNSILFAFLSLPSQAHGYWCSILFHKIPHTPSILSLLVSASRILEPPNCCPSLQLGGHTLKLVAYSQHFLFHFQSTTSLAVVHSNRMVFYNIDSLCSFRHVKLGKEEPKEKCRKEVMGKKKVIGYLGRRMLEVQVQGQKVVYRVREGESTTVRLGIEFVGEGRLDMQGVAIRARIMRYVKKVINYKERKRISQQTLIQGLNN